ncbi:MAG: metallophosphoesterase [Armatimonadetes bacterium]|nr:metallophosphoesterase [Armatimonadota bacterium]MDI9584027.1 metallophosphoesterase [Acidobacteriota bacterium]
MAREFDLSSVVALRDADLCFAHVCDTHVTDEGSARILAEATEAINALGPDFVVFGGDLANHGDAGSYRHLRAAIGALQSPAYHVVGNHDFLGSKTLFAASLGPLNAAFDYAGYHVIILDSTGPSTLTWEGLFTGEAVVWLEEHLAGVPVSRPLLLFTHHGIWSPDEHDPRRNLLWDVLNWKPVHRALEGRNLVLACAGHAHENHEARRGDTTFLWTAALSTNRANHGDEPPGFRIVWLRGRQVQTCWVPWVETEGTGQ